MEYLPAGQRVPDTQYRELLTRILRDGQPAATRQGPRAITLMQQTLRYDLRNGFPVITDRSLASFWRKPIGELCAFINGATTLDQFEEFGCDWWGPWATESKTQSRGLEIGDIGEGSYGGAFRHFPNGELGGFDQFQHLVEQIRDLPYDRTHFVSPWIPQYQVRGKGKTPRSTIAPCHGWVHVRVINEQLHLHMFQRSGDVPIGVPANMIQYSALMLMLERLTGFPASTYYHTISDAHVYEDQIPAARTLVERAPPILPTVRLNADGMGIRDIHDFRAEHFEIAEYLPLQPLRIPVSA